MTARRFSVDPLDITPVDPWPAVQDDPTVRLPPEMRGMPGVDEWAAAEQARPQRREIYGRVYEAITGDPQDGPHPYVGKTTQTIHQRVHTSRSAHTSPESIAKDPWKARILPGRDGYRQLETVYATGDPVRDEAELRRIEAFWIDRLQTTHNKVRPVRPPRHLGPRPGAKPARPVQRPTAAELRARRRARIFLAFAATLTAMLGWLFSRSDWETPWVPVVATFTLGSLLAWVIFARAQKFVRRIRRKW